jgi:hypothetical protein
MAGCDILFFLVLYRAPFLSSDQSVSNAAKYQNVTVPMVEFHSKCWLYFTFASLLGQISSRNQSQWQANI